MASLRLLPLFALPVLSGVLLAFAIATFEQDPEAAQQLTTESEATVQPGTEPAVQEPAATPTPEDSESVTNTTPRADVSPLANLNFDGLFERDRFSDYWRGNITPDIAEILENGFPGRVYQP